MKEEEEKKRTFVSLIKKKIYEIKLVQKPRIDSFLVICPCSNCCDCSVCWDICDNCDDDEISLDWLSFNFSCSSRINIENESLSMSFSSIQLKKKMKKKQILNDFHFNLNEK